MPSRLFACLQFCTSVMQKPNVSDQVHQRQNTCSIMLDDVGITFASHSGVSSNF